VTGLCGYAWGCAGTALTRRQHAAPRRLGLGPDGSSPILECVLVRGGAVGLREWPLVGAGGHCFVSFRLKRSNYALTTAPLERLQNPPGTAAAVGSEAYAHHGPTFPLPLHGFEGQLSPGKAPQRSQRRCARRCGLSSHRRLQAFYLRRCCWRYGAAKYGRRSAAMSAWSCRDVENARILVAEVLYEAPNRGHGTPCETVLRGNTVLDLFSGTGGFNTIRASDFS
jgi:hypothetical protein